MRIGWQADGTAERGEVVHVGSGQRTAAHEGIERAVEGLEVGAVTAPVQRPGADEPAQGLGRHRPLHRVELRQAEVERERLRRRVRHHATRVAEIPGQPVGVAVDVARCARHRAVARELAVVEELAALAQARWHRVPGRDRHLAEDRVGRGVDQGDGVAEPVEHVEHALRRVQRQRPRPALVTGVDLRSRGAADLDSRQNGAVVVEHADAIGALRGDVDAPGGGVDRDAERLGQRRRQRLRVRQLAVVDQRVEIDRRHRRRTTGRDPRDATVDGVAAQRRLEPHQVAGLGVGDPQITRRRVHGDAGVGRADRVEVARHRERRGVDLGDVVIGQREGHDAGPGRVVGADDDGLRRRRRQRRVGRRRRRWREELGHERGAVARALHDGVDAAAVGADGQRARVLAEHRDDAERRP